MQEVFQPIHQEDQLVLYIALILAIVGAIGMVITLRRKVERSRHNQNMLIAMLLFFLTTISAGTALFSWLSMHETGPVTIYAYAIETPYGRVAFGEIKKAEIITDQPIGLLPTGSNSRSVKLLVIEESSGKAHVLSEKNYDIQRILGAMRKARKQKK
jgi:hypothetical protein